MTHESDLKLTGWLCRKNLNHRVNFYSDIACGKITPEVVKEYLIYEGNLLSSKGEDHYYDIRDRFNTEHAPLDFLFLNRAGFVSHKIALFGATLKATTPVPINGSIHTPEKLLGTILFIQGTSLVLIP